MSKTIANRDFWNANPDAVVGGIRYASKEERAALVASELAFEITSIRFDPHKKYKGTKQPRWELTFAMPESLVTPNDATYRDDGTLVPVMRLLTLAANPQRDSVCQSMTDFMRDSGASIWSRLGQQTTDDGTPYYVLTPPSDDVPF